MEYDTLDNATTLDAARQDPVGFVRRMDRAIVDEIQLAPELLLAIKESVDSAQRAGRFLLTGSANLMTLPRVADSLAGRMEVVRLLLLAQSEISTADGSFLVDAFPNEVGICNDGFLCGIASLRGHCLANCHGVHVLGEEDRLMYRSNSAPRGLRPASALGYSS